MPNRWINDGLGFPTHICITRPRWIKPLQWRHNGSDSVSNHQPHDCLLNRLFRRRSKKTPKFGVTGFCAGNSPGTGGFPTQMASYAENVSIWWRHHAVAWHLGVKLLPRSLLACHQLNAFIGFFKKIYLKISVVGGRVCSDFTVFSPQIDSVRFIIRHAMKLSVKGG